MPGEYADVFSAPLVIATSEAGFTSPHVEEFQLLIDIEDGGAGRIIGTVKEKGSPANTPLSRRVVIQNHRDKRTVRETISDAGTGVYEFLEIAMGRTYDVISYDHTGIYRAVIADNLSPELMT